MTLAAAAPVAGGALQQCRAAGRGKRCPGVHGAQAPFKAVQGRTLNHRELKRSSSCWATAMNPARWLQLLPLASSLTSLQACSGPGGGADAAPLHPLHNTPAPMSRPATQQARAPPLHECIPTPPAAPGSPHTPAVHLCTLPLAPAAAQQRHQSRRRCRPHRHRPLGQPLQQQRHPLLVRGVGAEHCWEGLGGLGQGALGAPVAGQVGGELQQGLLHLQGGCVPAGRGPRGGG
jgi:hypothetical protein